MSNKPINVATIRTARCPGCCVCEGGANNIKRKTVLWTIGICTCGMGLIILPFFKKCTTCGHSTFMNNHKAKHI